MASNPYKRCHDFPNEDNEEVFRNSYQSSVIIMPPESVCDQIQEIRSKHDRSFHRWMPHVKLIYPFVDDQGDLFKNAADVISERLANIQPFRVLMSKDSFQKHEGKKSCTLWLNLLDPHLAAQGTVSQPHQSILDIQKCLDEYLPNHRNKKKPKQEKMYVPHLDLGQFKKNLCEEFKLQFEEKWQDVEFDVNEIYLISKSIEDKGEPFRIRHSVKLGTGHQLPS